MNVATNWHSQVRQLRLTHTLTQMSAIVKKKPNTIANYCQDNNLAYRYEADLRREQYTIFIDFCLYHHLIDSRCVTSVSCFASVKLQRGAIVAAAYEVIGVMTCNANRTSYYDYWKFPIVNPEEIAYAKEKGEYLIKTLVNDFYQSKEGISFSACRRKVA